MNTQLRAADIHARVNWPAVLVRLGIDPTFVRLKKSGPCPACNGTDRYTFDNRKGRGDFICRGCGPGSGFDLLMRVHGWTFSEARKHVLEVSGHEGASATAPRTSPDVRTADFTSAAAPHPPRSVRALVTSSCSPGDCPDVIAYLDSRGLWPPPGDTALRAHVSVQYIDDGQSIGRFAALVAPVTDIDGELVSAHVTYLKEGKKADVPAPRKLLSKTTGRRGCAVRLMPFGEVLGIAEGIETALSAALTDNVPVWAALNTALLAKFEPPDTVRTLRIYADRDEPGLLAACQLMQRLQGRLHLEVRVPNGSHKDFNDQLAAGKYARKTL